MKPNWSKEKIKDGFDRFLKENGRLPTAREIDKISYLPSSRTIQRDYGGLEQLRKQLGFDVAHFGKGESRSKIASFVNKKGLEAESLVKGLLVSKFGEMFVHAEKPIYSDSKNRLDFYVYSPSGDFGVDVFNPKDIFSMAASLSIKAISYNEFQKKLYLVVTNIAIGRTQINRIILNKKNALKDNFSVVGINDFELMLKGMKSYRILNEGDN